MVRVCEIEITNEHNDGKQKKKEKEVEEMARKRQTVEEKRKREEEIFSILSKIHITSVIKDFDILLECVVGITE